MRKILILSAALLLSCSSSDEELMEQECQMCERYTVRHSNRGGSSGTYWFNECQVRNFLASAGVNWQNGFLTEEQCRLISAESGCQ